jgi:hypothetical protein
LIYHPDTTSGGSNRQNQHAGRITMSIIRTGTRHGASTDHKIDWQPS